MKQGASIGANATIVCDHVVGRWELIASGAVVTKDVPGHAVMMGVPARQCGSACECGEVLKNTMVCKACARMYREGEYGLEEAK